MTTWTKEGTKGSSDTTYSASDILLKSDDPDITLDINTASSSSRAELRFSEEGQEKGYIGYHKGDNVLKITTTHTGQNESIAIIPQGTGGVGIGTETPVSHLTLRNDSASGDAAITFQSASSSIYWIGMESDEGASKLHIGRGANWTTALGTNDMVLSAGKVGIGTAAPGENLTVAGEDPGIWIQHDSVNEDASGHLDFTESSASFDSIGGYGWRILNDGDTPSNTGILRIQSGNQTIVTDRLVIERDTGNVGIGTDSPTTTLQVVGSFTTGLVTIAADDAITATEHAGRINLLGEVGGNALVTLTLPDATGTGNVYKFIVSVVNTSSYKFLVPDADNTIDGQIMITDADGTAATSFVTAATTDTIILNGGTSGGGAIGDYIELTDIAANQWAVSGMVTCPAGSNIATMFSATV